MVCVHFRGGRPYGEEEEFFNDGRHMRRPIVRSLVTDEAFVSLLISDGSTKPMAKFSLGIFQASRKGSSPSWTRHLQGCSVDCQCP